MNLAGERRARTIGLMIAIVVLVTAVVVVVARAVSGSWAGSGAVGAISGIVFTATYAWLYRARRRTSDRP